MADLGPMAVAEAPWLQCFKAQLAPSVTAKSWYDALPSRGLKMWRSKGRSYKQKGWHGGGVFWVSFYLHVFFFAGEDVKNGDSLKVSLGKSN